MIPVHEPMTLLTDYLLGGLSATLSVRMLRRGPRASRAWWATALASCALAAFAGGTYHGFLPWIPEAVAATLWRVTMASIGVASFGAVLATAAGHLPVRSGTAIRIVASVKIVGYLAWAMLDPAFVVAIADYSLAFLFVLWAHLRSWRRRGDSSALTVATGVLVSFAAAGIQALGIAPHASFNHNDLYHLVQMLGTWLLYRGAVSPAEA